MKRSWIFSSADSLFFKDSTPFEAGQGGRSELKSQFPPSMYTMQGALRTAVASGQGWIKDSAKIDLPPEMGDQDSLGEIRLQGPYIRWYGQRIYPLPKHIMMTKEMCDFVFLIPGEEVECDLETVALPIPSQRVQGMKTPENIFVSGLGLTKILNGKLPDRKECYLGKDLWQMERRVGLQRDINTRTAQDKMLYSTVHIRPREGLELEILETGIPDEWTENVPKMVRLGGEGRLSFLEKEEYHIEKVPLFPELKAQDAKIHYVAILLTPGYYSDFSDVLRNGPSGLPGNCISACIGKLEVSGGWDLKNNCSRPTTPRVPAGSVWFFRADVSAIEYLEELHGTCLGEKTSYGFGQILIGNWEVK